jgi:N-ethylmaleimide reductase
MHSMLFDPFSLGPIPLQNRIVMAPMTRNRADADHIPTPLMVGYYASRASIGLIVTEGTSPSANGLGYPRMPGLFDARHVGAWRPITEAVHAKGGKIFVQLMHTGRAGHVANLPAGAEVVSATDVPLPGELWTDALGMQTPTTPRAMTEDDIQHAIGEFANSARLAVEAGFDGIELHGANGYLIEQFLNANVNTRQDAWGGSAEARNRFALEVVKATVAAIGASRVGIRLSPYGAYNGTGAFDGVDTQYLALATELGALGLAYLHLVDHSSMGAPAIPVEFKQALRQQFGRVFIASGGFDAARAEQLLAAGAADLVAFGRPALANPDLVERLKHALPLNAPDFKTFYTPGEVGYSDYPTYEAASV